MTSIYIQKRLLEKEERVSELGKGSAGSPQILVSNKNYLV